MNVLIAFVLPVVGEFDGFAVSIHHWWKVVMGLYVAEHAKEMIPTFVVWLACVVGHVSDCACLSYHGRLISGVLGKFSNRDIQWVRAESVRSVSSEIGMTGVESGHQC